MVYSNDDQSISEMVGGEPQASTQALSGKPGALKTAPPRRSKHSVGTTDGDVTSEHPNRLLTPAAAIAHLLPHLRSRPLAKSLICDGIRDGDLRLLYKGKAEFSGSDPLAALAEAKANRKEGKALGILPKSFLRVLSAWNDDTGNWNWTKAEFIVSRPSEVVKSFALIGVKFYRSEIDNLLTLNGFATSGSEDGPPLSQPKEDLLHELLQLALTGKLKKLRSAKKTARVIFEAKDPQGRSRVGATEGTIRKWLGPIFKRSVKDYMY